MIAIPATAILLTNLDFWEKIRAVCTIVEEQRTALARYWSGDPFALLLFASTVPTRSIMMCREEVVG